MYVCVCAQSCLTPCDPWTVACQAPLPMEISSQEYCSGLAFPSPGDLLNPGIEPTSHTSPITADRFFTTSTTWEALYTHTYIYTCIYLCCIYLQQRWHGIVK